jgi:hypothetical protein
MLMGVCTMVASVGDAHRDDDGGSSHGVLVSVAESEDCATIGPGNVAHGDGNNKPSSGTNRLVAKLIDQNPS